MKVADFGIARAASSTEISTSLVLGTARYMSPEQATGEPVGPPSDLYSLGIVLYEMLTGEPPYGGENSIAVATQHVNEPPRHPREANSAVPEDLDALTVKLMQKRPEDRYASASALAEDLRRVRDGLSPLAVASEATTGVVSPIAPHRNGRRSVAALLAGLLVLLLGVGAWGTWQDAGGGEVIGSLRDLPGEARETLEGAGRALGATEAEIPRVEGLTREEAENRLKDAGFGVVIVRRKSPPEDMGRVLEQSVPGGRKAEKGSNIILAVGKGPSEVEVPDLIYISRVEDQLDRAGLKLGEVREAPSDTVSEGVVISQDPAERETVKRGTTVNLTVSTGPEQATAPASRERDPDTGRGAASEQAPAPRENAATSQVGQDEAPTPSETSAPAEGAAPPQQPEPAPALEPAPEPAPVEPAPVPREPEAPVYEQPVPAEPVSEEPAPTEPVDEEPPPPAEQPPAEQPPAEQPPLERPPAEQPPAEQPSADDGRSYGERGEYGDGDEQYAGDDGYGDNRGRGGDYGEDGDQ
jgi:serine/threonine-protein kinase